jgi:hypothetical protein
MGTTAVERYPLGGTDMNGVMAYFSLWQGNVCLGYSALDKEGKRQRTRSGRFEPTPAAESLGPLMQVHEARMPGSPVRQNQLPRAGEWRSMTSGATSIEIALGLSDMAAAIPSVAEDKRLELRDSDGNAVPTESIGMMQRPLVPGEVAGADVWVLTVTLVKSVQRAT